MNEVGQRSDSGQSSRLITIGVSASLVILAGLMVVLNQGDSDLATWLIPVAALAIMLVAAWRVAPIVSLIGLALVTLLWALLELPGSLGMLMIAPLGWLWIGRSHSFRQCVLASIFAVVVALLEGIVFLANGNGTAIDFVGNVLIVMLVILVASSIPRLRSPSTDSLPHSDVAPGSANQPTDPGASVAAETDTQPQPEWLEQLSRREREVLAQLVDGASNNEIAENLHIGLSTVKTHVSSILRKADAQSRYAVALELRPGPTTSLDAPSGSDAL